MHVAPPGKTPVLSVVNETVPPGLDGEPGAVSVTVAVQDAVSNAGIEEGVQVTEVEVGRLLTAVVAVALLLPVLGSFVALVALAVFMIEDGADPVTLTTSVKVCPAPAARVAVVQLTVPVVPTAGVVQVNVVPEPWLRETNVVPAGRVSVSVTLCASEGPLFVMPME